MTIINLPILEAPIDMENISLINQTNNFFSESEQALILSNNVEDLPINLQHKIKQFTE